MANSCVGPPAMLNRRTISTPQSHVLQAALLFAISTRSGAIGAEVADSCVGPQAMLNRRTLSTSQSYALQAALLLAISTRSGALG